MPREYSATPTQDLGRDHMGVVMRRTPFRAVIAVMALCIVAAACSKPASRNATGPDNTNLNPTAAAPVSPGATTSASASASAKPGAKVAGKTGTSSATHTGPGTTNSNAVAQEPGVNQSQALAVGQKIYPQSTSRGPKPYYSGVGDKTIQLDFSIDKTSCGVNVINAITAAGGALPTTSQYYRAAPTTQDKLTAERVETINLMVKYWNDHAFDTASYLPHIRPLMGNDPKNQFFGRHLVANIIDGGSNQCPDKTKAAAVQAAEQDHAFSVFTDYDGSQYNMAADLHTVPVSRRPMHFGTLWLSDSTYTKFAPFAWTQFASGTTIANQLASYVCSKLVGKKATNSPKTEANGGYKNTMRKFGLVHTNLPQDQPLIADFKAGLNRYCKGKGGAGIIAKEISYDGTDFSNAQKDDTNLVVQLHTGGVTSVIMLGDPVQGLFQLADAKGQNYYPEWITSSVGYMDSNTVQRLWDQDEAAGDFGLSELGIFGGFGFGAGDPFWMYHAYHKTAPDGKPCDPTSEAGMDHGGGASGTVANYCKAPTALATWYYTLLPFIGGLLFAGPDATPQHVTVGLQHYPPTRYGGNGPTTDPRPALVGAGPGKYNFVVDAVEWKWRPDFTSPKPESKKGWVEYPDCQRHYLLWPDNLAPNWTKSDSNYTAWCSGPNGYPKTLPSDGTH